MTISVIFGLCNFINSRMNIFVQCIINALAIYNRSKTINAIFKLSRMIETE